MTGQGEDILAWTLAAVTAREQKATQAAEEFGAAWYYDDGFVLARHEDSMVATGSQDFMDRQQGDHIAANDPESVLRRCAADRKALERHTLHRTVRDTTWMAFGCYHPTKHDSRCAFDKQCWPCPDFLSLAEGYGWTEGER